MSTQTILIIDDDPVVADMFGEAFSLNGFKGDVFIDSSEALSAFNSDSDKYQTVICVIMPGKCGIEIAVEIKKLNPLVRVILMADDKKDYDNANSPSEISDHFVTKPEDVRGVLKLISDINKAN
jgi:two-component system response regulator MtrA